MPPVEIKEFLRISEATEKHRKLMGLDDRTLRRISEIKKEFDLTSKHRAHFAVPDIAQRQIEDLHYAIQERAALAVGPIMNSIASANVAALGLADIFQNQKTAIDDLIALGSVRVDEWRRSIEALGAVAVNEHLEGQMAFLAERSFLAQANFLGIDLAARSPNLEATADILAASQVAFEGFSTSYKDLFESYLVPATSILNLPPSLIEFPTYEFFNEVDLLSTTAVHEASDFGEEIVVVREEIHRDTYDLVAVELQRVNPAWLNMLEGARQSFKSDNPDRVRHSITSLRELLREVMHYLSPEEELRAWSDTPENFSNNRPTRKARLRYIVREIDHGPFSDFVRKDIESMIEMINVFQAGTHATQSSLTEAQVAALLARVEGVVLFLFTIANR